MRKGSCELEVPGSKLDEAVWGVKGASGNGGADGASTPASLSRISPGMPPALPESWASMSPITPQRTPGVADPEIGPSRSGTRREAAGKPLLLPISLLDGAPPGVRPVGSGPRSEPSQRAPGADTARQGSQAQPPSGRQAVVEASESGSLTTKCHGPESGQGLKSFRKRCFVLKTMVLRMGHVRRVECFRCFWQKDKNCKLFGVSPVNGRRTTRAIN
jgi:hypothetical protein